MWNFNSLLKTSLKPRLILPNYQSVRGIKPRKPFWEGIAKSKMFVLKKEKEKGTPEEEAEYERLKTIYDRQLDSLLKFIRTDDPLLKEASNQSFLEKQWQTMLNKKIEESWVENEIFNASSAELRKKRLEARNEKLLKEAEEKLQQENKIMEEKRQKLQEVVRIEKEQIHTYITHETLSEAVENCLNTTVEYNFAIDLNGNKILGKDPYIENLGQRKVNQLDKL